MEPIPVLSVLLLQARWLPKCHLYQNPSSIVYKREEHMKKTGRSTTPTQDGFTNEKEKDRDQKLPLKKQPPFFAHAKHLLTAMYMRGKGKSKNDNRSSRSLKKRNYQDKEKIFASSSLRVYVRHVYYYFDWIRNQGIHLRSFAEARDYLQLYLSCLEKEGKSPYYIKLAGCAVLKLYPGHYLGEFETPDRAREEIIRSRHHTLEYFEKIKNQNPELFLFGLATGLRKDKELSKVRGIDLREKNEKYYIHIKGKNGQYRDAPIIGDEKTIAKVVEMMKGAGESKLFGPEGVYGRIPFHYDQHVLRSIYAVCIYLSNERDLEDVPSKDKYYCRNDYNGIVLDRKAMMIASEALGHHRVNVIAASYIWPMVTMKKELQSFFGIQSREVKH